jgi:hypothetical protein
MIGGDELGEKKKIFRLFLLFFAEQLRLLE